MADVIKPKAILVGPTRIHNYLVDMRPDWDFLPPVDTIDALHRGLNDGAIDNDIQIILVIDTLFDPYGNDVIFEKFLGFMGQYCFIGILNYFMKRRQDFDPVEGAEKTQKMRDAIDRETYAIGASDNSHYYLIDPNRPNPSIEQALGEFVTVRTADNAQAVDIIKGEVTDEGTANSQFESNEPVRDLANNLDMARSSNSDRLGQVVAVTSSKGGSGKSTISTTLASYIAYASQESVRQGFEKRPLKVCIIDMDVRNGQLGYISGHIKPTVIELRLRGISLETVQDVAIHDDNLNCDLILAPKRPRHADDTPAEFYVELISLLKQEYDYIILDTSTRYTDELLEFVAYPMADQIIFVTDIVSSSIFGMTRWILEVTGPKTKNGMGINPNKIGIVVNKNLPNVNMSAEKIVKSAKGLPIISVVPSAPKVIAHAINTQSVNLLLKHKDFMPSIRLIAKAVVGRKYKLASTPGM